MKRLGIDLGARRIGVAVHAEEGVPARPLETLELPEANQAVNAVTAVVKREAADEVVVGLPLNMDGTEGMKARAARTFAALLGRKTKVPVILWDERLSTVQAQRARTASGRKGREGIDAEVAAILLQAYLDSKAGAVAWLDDPDR
ncbi:MAG: Holliday junction resolvase RuvX [Deltaproteobacteria bacterium]|nr:Holliday junction resolvase RuvX [Myxococcales bacterium]MDP3218652.1 Holliday junction resolvase RuvX [Deltaproteobacteria bacterium]